jgi:hypothetical protein
LSRNFIDCLQGLFEIVQEFEVTAFEMEAAVDAAPVLHVSTLEIASSNDLNEPLMAAQVPLDTSILTLGIDISGNGAFFLHFV